MRTKVWFQLKTINVIGKFINFEFGKFHRINF